MDQSGSPLVDQPGNPNLLCLRRVISKATQNAITEVDFQRQQMQRRQAQAHPKGRLFEGLSWLK